MAAGAELVHLAGLELLLRPGTSDAAAARENLEELPVLRHLCVGPGQNWLDCGAYVGSFSLSLLARAARVFWVEPDPASSALLRENLRSNGFVRVPGMEVAVLQEVPEGGTVELIQAPHTRGRKNYWSNTVFGKWKRDCARTTCRAASFGDVLRRARGSLPRCNSWNLKLDVEGAELEILERGDLSLYQQIYFEYHFQADPSVARARRILARIAALGFEVRTTRLPTGDTPAFFSETVFTAWAWRPR